MDRVLPIVFLNLSGEMMYVIQQRLEAQNISLDKSAKVIQDILSTMLNDQFIEELFKLQKMYSRKAMQSVFEKLVHSSIMRLNANSMGKLYDLMLMVFKYQVVNCHRPEDIFLVTLNHLDAIKCCAKPYPDLIEKVKNLHSLLVSTYKDMSAVDYECLFNCITAFLQDLNIRVSVLMKLGYQKPNGDIVPLYEKSNEELESVKLSLPRDEEDTSSDVFNVNKLMFPDCSLDFDGDRGTSLGTNIYIISAVSEQPKELSSEKPSSPDVTVESNEKEKENIQGLEELSLLSRLIGKCNQSDNMPEITLASPDEEDMNDVHNMLIKDNCSVVNINASKVCQQELGKISSELYVNKEEREKTDILDLLDIADSKII